VSTKQTICVYRSNKSTFLNTVVLNCDSVLCCLLAINADSSVYLSIHALTATKAVFVYETTTSGTKGYVLDVSGSTITPGTVRSIDATAAGSSTSLAALNTTQLLLVYNDGNVNERVLTISGSTISEGAETLADATAAGATGVKVAAMSATKALYAFRGNSPADLVLRLQSVSGSTPTPTGSPLRLATNFTDTAAGSYDMVALDANRVVITQAINGNVEGDILISLLDVSSTSPALLYNKIVNVGLFATVLVLNTTKLDANHVYVAFAGGASMGLDSFIITIGNDDKLFVSPVTEAIELNVTSALGYLACTALDSTHVLNACRNSSTYLASKVVEIAT